MMSANSTSLLQSNDIGIIKTLKAYFRNEMRKSVDAIEDTEHDIFP